MKIIVCYHWRVSNIVPDTLEGWQKARCTRLGDIQALRDLCAICIHPLC